LAKRRIAHWILPEPNAASARLQSIRGLQRPPIHNWPQSAIDRAVPLLFNETMAEDKAVLVGPTRARRRVVTSEVRLLLPNSKGRPYRYCGGRLGARFARQAGAFY
jgi:hypothetical protein